MSVWILLNVGISSLQFYGEHDREVCIKYLQNTWFSIAVDCCRGKNTILRSTRYTDIETGHVETLKEKPTCEQKNIIRSELFNILLYSNIYTRTWALKWSLYSYGLFIPIVNILGKTAFKSYRKNRREFDYYWFSVKMSSQTESFIVLQAPISYV